MSRTLVLVFATLMVVTLAVNPVDKIRNIVKEDTCATDSMAVVQPQIDAIMAELKQNPENLKAKADLLALVEKVRAIYEKCELNNKVDPVLGDVVEAGGVAFLLASNCFKDVGIVLLLADTIVQDPTDWTNDTIVLIFLYILGRQGYGDCEKFIHFLL